MRIDFQLCGREAFKALAGGITAGAVSRVAERGDRAVTEHSVESFPASDAPTY